MSDLIEFLRARLDEDEAAVKDAPFDPRDPNWHEGGKLWEISHSPEYVTAYISSTRVLREVEAKRRILAMHGPTVDPDGELSYPAAAKLCRTCGPGDTWEAEREPFGHLPCDHQRLLALPYSDHPDYDEAWRP